MRSSFAAPHFGHVITESRVIVFCYCTALNRFGADGYPALVVAAVNAFDVGLGVIKCHDCGFVPERHFRFSYTGNA